MDICRVDRNGIKLHEGDIVAECQVGDLTWEGKGIIRQRPLGVVVTCCTAHTCNMSEPEETDCYNIQQIRPGTVELTDNAPQWMVDSLSNGTQFASLHLSRFDGRFYAWDNIEIIGSVYDFPD